MENITNVSQTNITEIILQTINTLFSQLLASLDNNIYSLLDKLTFIDQNILSESVFTKLLGENSITSLIFLADALVFGFCIYYCIRLLFSNYSGFPVERPYTFVFRILLFSILMNGSYFLCSQLLTINYYFSSSILEIGKENLGTNISFSSFISQLNSVISLEQTSFNLFSFDGLIKCFISSGLISLLFSYSLRYILIQVLALITPFSILCLINSSTHFIFKSWFRCFISLLLVQSFVSFILIIIFSISFNDSNSFDKIIYIGAIYTLLRSNQYIRELIGGISTDINVNLKSFLKKGLI